MMNFYKSGTGRYLYFRGIYRTGEEHSWERHEGEFWKDLGRTCILR